ncbi:MAG: hypothetical protein SPK70_09680 [Succinivibrio dextrinosolvens]|nr:hypothetical protein [Succinivibrio dextrinosolvens]MDY6420368.1 hypothetical protein [Succinivibrio dextrinosolvens]MDY6471323.1 hypothetical protein [Succinivibrio dextrinosolvens]
MSNIPFEPKDGDYVSLIEKLGKTSIDEIKDEIAKSQKEHLHHAGVLNSPSIEENISLKNLNNSPEVSIDTSSRQNTISTKTYTKSENVNSLDIDSLVKKILKILLFIGFVFTAAITVFLAVSVDTDDEEIIIFPFIFYIIFVAVISSRLNKKKP